MNIRPATPRDAPAAARLLALSMGSFGDAFFGFGNPAHAVQALEKLFTFPNHRLSYGFTWLAELEGEIAGLLLAFPGKKGTALSLGMSRPLLAVYTLWGTLRLAWQSLAMLSDKEAEADEFYISNLAVRPDLQRRGIGRALLTHAEALAHEERLEKCSLIVDLANETAIRLYERLGFRLVSTTHTPWMVKHFHTSGHQRRVKSL